MAHHPGLTIYPITSADFPYPSYSMEYGNHNGGYSGYGSSGPDFNPNNNPNNNAIDNKNSDSIGPVHRSASYFFGFLITFVVLLLVFVCCGVASRRRYLAAQHRRRMHEMINQAGGVRAGPGAGRFMGFGGLLRVDEISGNGTEGTDEKEKPKFHEVRLGQPGVVTESEGVEWNEKGKESAEFYDYGLGEGVNELFGWERDRGSSTTSSQKMKMMKARSAVLWNWANITPLSASVVKLPKEMWLSKLSTNAAGNEGNRSISQSQPQSHWPRYPRTGYYAPTTLPRGFGLSDFTWPARPSVVQLRESGNEEREGPSLQWFAWSTFKRLGRGRNQNNGELGSSGGVYQLTPISAEVSGRSRSSSNGSTSGSPSNVPLGRSTLRSTPDSTRKGEPLEEWGLGAISAGGVKNENRKGVEIEVVVMVAMPWRQYFETVKVKVRRGYGPECTLRSGPIGPEYQIGLVDARVVAVEHE